MRWQTLGMAVVAAGLWNTGPANAQGRVDPAVTPAAATVRKTAPWDVYQKNYAELSDSTRALCLSSLRGMSWLSRDEVHLVNGRFIPGFNPTLVKVADDDGLLNQAFGAWALARSARLKGDERLAIRAAQSILALLSDAPRDSATGERMPSAARNRVAAASVLALAIFELPGAAELHPAADELCKFVRTRLQSDGTVRVADGEANFPAQSAQHAGMALTALAVSHRTAPAAWKKDALTNGLAHYRRAFAAEPTLEAVPWMTVAYAEFHLQTKDAAAAEFVFELTDWLRKVQYSDTVGSRAKWRGGFPHVKDGKLDASAPTVDTAAHALALVEACRMIRGMDRPDAERFDRNHAAAVQAMQFLTTLQYAEESTLHIADAFRPRVLGAFHPSASDGAVRVEQTALCVAAMAQYLIGGADR